MSEITLLETRFGSLMRTAPVLGYGWLEDAPGVAVLTHYFSEMESIMDTKLNTDGLQRPWCTSGSAPNNHSEIPPRSTAPACPGHRRL